MLRRPVLTPACAILAAACLVGCAPTPGTSDENEGQFLQSELDEFAADADADVYAGPAPLTVRFTAQTINASGPVTYTWNFDDRSAGSTEQNPVHTFRRRGWYLVTMDARDAAGHSYRINLQLHAWRPKDWERLQRGRDMRIVHHSIRELERKRARQGNPAAPVAGAEQVDPAP